jgi:predicted NACHT family NTPase
MAEQVYDWKRFWCPRSSQINPDDHGYLTDPESEYGKYANPDLVGLEAIADVPCLVLLGEPGIGKSQELINLKDFTENNLDDGHKVLKVNLRSCTSLKEDLFKDEQFIAWESGTHRLYLFLDSLDEGLLQIQTLATQLVDTFTKNQYRDKLNCLYLRIACRTAVFPNILEEGLKELWKESNLGIYELAPLRRIDVQASVKVHSLDADDFLNEVERKGVVPFAVKPITLKFLLNTFQKHHGQFPPEQKLVDLYLAGCKALCEEQNSSRRASKRTGKLKVEQRLMVAARIAVVTIFANRFAIWTETDLGDVSTEDVLLEKLCLENEARDTIEEVLDTGLFSSRGFSRMGWAHQTYAEFLAAWYLAKNEVPLAKIQALIFSSEDPDHQLIPQLHETAAWLASMRADVLQDIIKTDPDVLLQSDIPTDANIRALIVNNLLTLFEQEKLFDSHNYRRYEKLKHPGLVTQLQPYICNFGKQNRARNLAIDIAGACKIFEIQENLVSLVLDSSQSVHLRESAVHALFMIGNVDAIIQLKPLAIDQIAEDEDDQLKGYILDALWPDHITAEELFQSLTSPKKWSFLGGYTMFLNYKLVPKLKPNDLILALEWIENQNMWCFMHAFEKLGYGILSKAWENFDLPGVAESFAKIALIYWRDDRRIIIRNDLTKNLKSSDYFDEMKRCLLVEKAISIVLKTQEDFSFFSYYLVDDILVLDDFFWILEKFQFSCCSQAKKIWSELLQCRFNDQEAKQIDAVVIASQNDENVNKLFACYLKPIELESVQAEGLRANYLKTQERKKRQRDIPLIEPPPKERVLQCLDKLEKGNLSAWSQLNMEMTLKPDSQVYNNELEWDLTKLPGWHNADKITRTRIIDGAKQYILKQDNIPYDWIGSDQFNRPALAGGRALQLILKKDPYFLETLSFDTWQRWVSVIVASPCERYCEDEHLEIVKLAYLNAPNEAINTLMMLIDKIDQGHDYIASVDRKVIISASNRSL